MGRMGPIIKTHAPDRESPAEMRCANFGELPANLLGKGGTGDYTSTR